jgi:site-specific DNA-methyltransferase (adenine-specific)
MLYNVDMNNNESIYYSVKEAADIIGVSKQTLRRWDNNGKFPSKRHPINNYRVYSKSQLDSFVAELETKEGFNFNDQNIDGLPIHFETTNGKLYNLDAIEFLRYLPDNSVDLIFADPPYNIHKAQWDTFESQKAYIDWTMQWITEASRILTEKGSIYICGFSEILADIKWAASSYFRGCKWLVWYYRNKANMGNDWGRSHESILHFRKSKDFIFHIDNVRIPYNKHTLKYPKRDQAVTSQYGNGKKYSWEPNPYGAKPKDVFEIPTISNKAWEKYNHPTQKPVELLWKIISASTNDDSIVVDPFGGSGTTFAVSEALDLQWIGSELDSNYCNLISNRLSDSDHINRIASRKDQIQSNIRRTKLRG